MTTSARHLTRIVGLVAKLHQTSTALDKACVAALVAGATYEQVGSALGITRQATWALYHEDVAN